MNPSSGPHVSADKSESNGHAQAMPDVKCPMCMALNPGIHTRMLQIGPALLAAMFSCGKCHRILSISAIVDEPPPDDGLIVRP